MSVSAVAAINPTERLGANMTVEIRYRWLLLLISLVVLVMLRDYPWIMAGYVAFVVLLALTYTVLVPRRLVQRETIFRREALRLLAQQDAEAVRRLTARQWLLKNFGRADLVHEILALAATAAGEHGTACTEYRKAMGFAPPEERARLQLNLAAEELKAGQLDNAEARYRAALTKPRHAHLARTGLARTLLARGDASEEAVDLFRHLVANCNPAERESMETSLAEAERRLAST